MERQQASQMRHQEVTGMSPRISAVLGANEVPLYEDNNYSDVQL